MLFCVAASESFFPASVTFSDNFEAPNENADQLYKYIRYVSQLANAAEIMSWKGLKPIRVDRTHWLLIYTYACNTGHRAFVKICD